MAESCPTCGVQFGKRKRCYFCQPAKRKTGEDRTCKGCGKSFYAARWQLADVARNQGTYCSVACKGKVMSTRTRPLQDRAPYVNRQGYVMVPVASGRNQINYEAEHRIVIERKLGRKLTSDEQVHHINGDKADNAETNLLVLSNTEHQRLHDHFGALRVAPQTATRDCDFCGQSFTRGAHRAALYCSRSCRTQGLWRDGRMRK